jgi:hypothetical protein
VFSGKCSSLLSKRVFEKNAKNKFWIFWKHFRKKEIKGVSRRRKKQKQVNLNVQKPR